MIQGMQQILLNVLIEKSSLARSATSWWQMWSKWEHMHRIQCWLLGIRHEDSRLMRCLRLQAELWPLDMTLATVTLKDDWPSVPSLGFLSIQPFMLANHVLSFPASSRLQLEWQRCNSPLLRWTWLERRRTPASSCLILSTFLPWY